MVEMRPLIGKDQFRIQKNQNFMNVGTGALDRDEQFLGDNNPLLGLELKSSRYGLGPWARANQQSNSKTTRNKDAMQRSI